MKGIFTRAFTSSIVPREGVSPPTQRAAHSSIRSAPPCSARIASSTDPQQISTRTVQARPDVQARQRRGRGVPSVQERPQPKVADHREILVEEHEVGVRPDCEPTLARQPQHPRRDLARHAQRVGDPRPA